MLYKSAVASQQNVARWLDCVFGTKRDESPTVLKHGLLAVQQPGRDQARTCLCPFCCPFQCIPLQIPYWHWPMRPPVVQCRVLSRASLTVRVINTSNGVRVWDQNDTTTTTTTTSTSITIEYTIKAAQCMQPK